MSKALTRKVALVTGGSRSIGAAIVKRLAADGAAVALTYGASPDKADAVVRAIEATSGKTLAICADAGDVAAVKAAVAKTVQAFGRLDILVNNAGMAIVKPVNGLSLRSRFISTRWPRAALCSVASQRAAGIRPQPRCGSSSRAISNPLVASSGQGSTNSAGRALCGLAMSCAWRARCSKCARRSRGRTRG